MVFGRAATQTKKTQEDMSFSLPLKDDDAFNISLDLVSTSSTDTDSSISIGEEEVVSTRSDIESTFGKLRHRNCDFASHSQDVTLDDDSDSEHGLVPRSRRKAHAKFKNYVVYAFAALVGLSSLLSIKSNIVSNEDTAKWKHFNNYHVPIVRKAFTKYEPEDYYTIVLRGSRLDLLQQSLDSFSECRSVKEIQVDYRGGELPIALSAHDSRKVGPLSETTPTNALFLLREGIIMSCNEIEKGKLRLKCTNVFDAMRDKTDPYCL
jgi:hypothetical protein